MVRPSKNEKHNNAILIKQGELKTLSPGMKYNLYEYEDGSIHGETLCAIFDVASSKEEYERISEEELESIIYCSEMTIAR